MKSTEKNIQVDKAKIIGFSCPLIWKSWMFVVNLWVTVKFTMVWEAQMCILWLMFGKAFFFQYKKNNHFVQYLRREKKVSYSFSFVCFIQLRPLLAPRFECFCSLHLLWGSHHSLGLTSAYVFSRQQKHKHKENDLLLTLGPRR